VTNKLLVLKDGVSQMFGLTREVLENLSKLNQQQIKQAQQPTAQASKGEADNGAVLDASNNAENVKDVEQVEDATSDSSAKPAATTKKTKPKQAVTE
jgi:hypothetical protein